MYFCQAHVVTLRTLGSRCWQYSHNLLSRFGRPGEYSPQTLGWRGWGPALCTWWGNGEKTWDLWLYLPSKYTPICFTVFGTKKIGGLLIWEDSALTCLTHGSWQTETNRFLGSKSLLSRLCQLSCLWHGDPVCVKINQRPPSPSQFLCLVTRAPITDSSGKSGSQCLCELVLLLHKYFLSWSGLAQLLAYFRLKS